MSERSRKANVPCFTLDGLHQESSDILSVYRQGLLEVLKDAKSNRRQLALCVNERWADTFEVRPKPSPALWIGTHATYVANVMSPASIRSGSHIPDDPKGPSMEISCSTQHDRLALLHMLLLVCPLPRKFQRRLDCLCPCVHGEYHLILEEGRDLLGKLSEDRVVEGPGGEGEPLGLFN